MLHDDGFFISGMQGLKYFSVRAKLRDGEVRGFTMLYDQMMEGIVAPVMVAMASAFAPFPERRAPFAALAKSVEYGTGLIVSARRPYRHRAQGRRDGCQVIVCRRPRQCRARGRGQGETGWRCCASMAGTSCRRWPVARRRRKRAT